MVIMTLAAMHLIKKNSVLEKEHVIAEKLPSSLPAVSGILLLYAFIFPLDIYLRSGGRVRDCCLRLLQQVSTLPVKSLISGPINSTRLRCSIQTFISTERQALNA